MKEEIREVLGYKVPMLVYESVDEGDKAAGKAGAILAEAINNLLYRGTYADARELIEETVQELTKVPFKTKPVLKDDGSPEVDEKGVPITERDEDTDSTAKYVKRALATTPVDPAKLQDEITRKARGYKTNVNGAEVTILALAADITQRERKPRKPPVLPKGDKEAAVGIIRAGNISMFNDALKEYQLGVFAPTGDEEKDSVTLGWLCHAWRKAEAAKATNRFTVKAAPKTAAAVAAKK